MWLHAGDCDAMRWGHGLAEFGAYEYQQKRCHGPKTPGTQHRLRAEGAQPHDTSDSRQWTDNNGLPHVLHVTFQSCSCRNQTFLVKILIFFSFLIQKEELSKAQCPPKGRAVLVGPPGTAEFSG